MSFILKIAAFILLAIAATTLTGIANFSYSQPAESLLSFIFMSVETAVSHGPIGILIAVVLFYIFKKSIQLLLTTTLIITAIAAILFYFY